MVTKFEEIYRMIADVKAAQEGMTPAETVVEERVEMSGVHSRFAEAMRFLKNK